MSIPPPKKAADVSSNIIRDVSCYIYTCVSTAAGKIKSLAITSPKPRGKVRSRVS